MFRFDNLVERWCTAYKPISHNPSRDGRGKRFFRMDNLDERTDIIKALAPTAQCDLFVSCITAFDGDLVAESESASKPRFWSWRRHVLFWARANRGGMTTAPLDEEAAADAKARAVETAQHFIAFLDYCQDPNRGNMKELSGIDLFSVSLATLPLSFGDWYIASLSFDHDESRQLCLNTTTDYDTDSLPDLFPSVDFRKAK